VQSILKGSGVHLRFLMARAQTDAAFRQRFRENFTLERRAALKSILLQGVERGEIAADRNMDLVVDLVFGAMWYRLLTGYAPINRNFADELTGVVVDLVGGNAA